VGLIPSGGRVAAREGPDIRRPPFQPLSVPRIPSMPQNAPLGEHQARRQPRAVNFDRSDQHPLPEARAFDRRPEAPVATWTRPGPLRGPKEGPRPFCFGDLCKFNLGRSVVQVREGDNAVAARNREIPWPTSRPTRRGRHDPPRLSPIRCEANSGARARLGRRDARSRSPILRLFLQRVGAGR